MSIDIQTTIRCLVERADEAIANTLGDPWTELDAETKEELVTSEADIRLALAMLEGAKEALETVLKTLPAGTENAETIAGFKVGVKQGSTFDKERFMAALPPTSRPELYKQEPDLEAIKKVMAPAALVDYYKLSKPSLDFKAL